MLLIPTLAEPSTAKAQVGGYRWNRRTGHHSVSLIVPPSPPRRSSATRGSVVQHSGQLAGEPLLVSTVQRGSVGSHQGQYVVAGCLRPRLDDSPQRLPVGSAGETARREHPVGAGTRYGAAMSSRLRGMRPGASVPLGQGSPGEAHR
jgi:hypothetical protein